MVKRYPNCILLLSTKKLVVIDVLSEEVCRTIPTDSIQQLELSKEKHTTILHTGDIQLSIQIGNANRRTDFVQALRNLLPKK